MKKILFTLSLLLGLNASAQSICFVSADFNDATNFIVFWEKPLDILLYDSVFIYRRLPATESAFTKIGATSMANDGSYYEDTNVTTYITTDYAISWLDTNGVETVLSYYHRPVILDYQAGNLIWTMYEKEFVTGDAWVLSYKCMRDGLGLGFFDEMGLWTASGGGGNWFDEEAAVQTDLVYQMHMEMPTCYVEGRANINTSRSNIKNQFSNAEATVEENETISFTLAPNPTSDFLNVVVDTKFANQEYIVSDANGRIIETGKLIGSHIQVDLSNEPNNTYMFTVKYQGKMHSKFFVKN